MMNLPDLRMVVVGSPGVTNPEATNFEAGSMALVRAELRRMLDSADFDASERNRRFLEYVVEETLVGRADRIKAYNVATIVFGRDVSFDPQLDPVVRMEARRLRRSLEHFYLVDGQAGSIRIALPKGSYVPKFENLGADEPFAQAAITDRTNAETAWQAPAILISTFEVEGDEPVRVNYANGLVRQLAVGLSRFPEFRIFTSSTAANRRVNPDLEQEAHWADVDLVLEGETSVVRDVLEVKATLAYTRGGKVIWGEVLKEDTTFGGLLDARDRLGDRMVRILAERAADILSSISHDEGREGRNHLPLQALAEYGRYRRSLRRDLFRIARECLEQAVSVDPGYAEGCACLSQIYSDGHRFGFASEAPERLQLLASEYAQKAVEMSFNSSRACHAQGIACWFTGETAASLAALETAFALNPNASDAMLDLGFYRCLVGDWTRGVPLIEEALSSGVGLAGIQRTGLALHHFSNRRYELAFAEAIKVRTPHVTHGLVVQAIALVRLGRRTEAEQTISRILALNPDYGRDALNEFGGSFVDSDLAGEIRSALRDAGLGGACPGVLISARSARA